MSTRENRTPPVTADRSRIVLGSRSPRRRELLGSIVGLNQLIILPPSTSAEPGFSDVVSNSDIERRLNEIVRMKHDDVCQQISNNPLPAEPFVVVADTIVVANDGDGLRVVLGQPEASRWKDDVRSWFRQWLSGKTHEVWTCVRVSHGNQQRQTTVRSKVTFCEVSDGLLNWYVSTGESVGKAGGYAIQGYAAAFVTQLTGSLTNVIGLPVLEVVKLLSELGWSREET